MKRHILILSLTLTVLVTSGCIQTLSPYKKVTDIVVHYDRYRDHTIQVVGRVVPGTLVRENMTTRFDLTDENNTLHIILTQEYIRIEENRTAVVVGKLTSPDTVIAERVLLKCPTVAKAE